MRVLDTLHKVLAFMDQFQIQLSLEDDIHGRLDGQQFILGASDATTEEEPPAVSTGGSAVDDFVLVRLG